MKTLRVGLIGFGFIGKVHAYSHRNLALFYDQQEFCSKITHVCTSHADTAEKAALRLGDGVKPVTDFREITENPEIDVVDIATPNSQHFEALLSAIAHQKNIYCDKPLTVTYDEAQKVQEALKNYHGIAQMTLQNRFFPSVIRAKQLIDAGKVGRVLEFRGSFLHSGSSDPEAPLKWKLEAGTLADLGSHILDLVSWLTGPFTEVCASSYIAYPMRHDAKDPKVMRPVTAEDSVQILARLADGASGTITASKIATGTEDEVSFEIYGTNGAIRIEPMNFNKLYFYDRLAADAPQGGLRGWTAIDCGQRYDAPAGFPTPKAIIGWLRGHEHCLYTFMNSVATGKVPADGPTLARGIEIQYLMHRVQESIRTKSWQKI